MSFIKGNFYRTQNGSKVRFDGWDVDGDAVFTVVIGGHGDPDFCGEGVGEEYYTLPSGQILRSLGISEEALGMDIAGEWEG